VAADQPLTDRDLDAVTTTATWTWRRRYAEPTR
jgi:hypothetical protein